MGIITLTDRISVSVRAKNETERNSQRRATGKNIANALTSGGNANISDDLADQLGNTSKPTIADEQGREWVAMSDIIAAGKKMQQEGAFGSETPGTISENGVVYGLENARFYSYCYNWDSRAQKDSNKVEYHQGSEVTFSGRTIGFLNSTVSTRFPTYFYSTSPFITYREVNYRNVVKQGVAEFATSSQTINVTLNGKTYTFYILMGAPSSDSGGDGGGAINTLAASWPNPDTNFNDTLEDVVYLPDAKNVTKSVAAALFGVATGGSLIDWTKPDDEIEEDIRNLHETWDVSDHAGSVNANGTYVLAGPIEFNPGD